MKHRLFNIVSLLLLGLCMAMGVIWMRSYGNPAVWRLWMGKDSACFLVCSSGQIRVAEQGIEPSEPPSFKSVDLSIYGVIDARSVQMNGFEARRLQLQFPLRAYHGSAGFEVANVSRPASPVPSPFQVIWRAVAVPCWFLILLMAILPVVHFGRKMRVRHRLRDGLCAKCGYDLRASKERCPECGTAIPFDSATCCEEKHSRLRKES